jgi:hypothetical protein
VNYVTSSLAPTFRKSGIILEISLNQLAQAEECVLLFSEAAGIRSAGV